MTVIRTKCSDFTLIQAELAQVDILIDILHEAAAWVKTKGVGHRPKIPDKFKPRIVDLFRISPYHPHVRFTLDHSINF